MLMKDGDIIVDKDSPEITAEMWRDAVVTDRRPPKKNITLRRTTRRSSTGSRPGARGTKRE
jgi:hypothetical protein